MKSFPMFHRTTGRVIVIAGSGEQAAQKARLILKTDAMIRILGRDLDPELADLVASGRAEYRDTATAADFADAMLVFVATGCVGSDAALHALAKSAGATVNVVDRPDLCDVTTPSIVDRDPVVVAIGTEGTAPVLGRNIKTAIERMLDPRLGGYAALAGRLRGAVAARVPHGQRRAFWHWAFSGEAWNAHRRGAERDAANILKQAIDSGAAHLPMLGRIAIVGAGPGARDLMTLRAVERLQEADVIFHDRLVDPDTLELARRDAERVFVGALNGAHGWPLETLRARIISDAERGRRVVWLIAGDPAALSDDSTHLATDIPVEIVPGITAATPATPLRAALS